MPDGKWKKEAARDILALGSWVFYALVVIRAAILPNQTFLFRLLIAAAFFILAEAVYGKYDKRIARGLVLAVFTSLYYRVMLYTTFVGLVYILMIFCSKYSGTKGKEIVKGIAFGLIGLGLGYYLAGLLV